MTINAFKRRFRDLLIREKLVALIMTTSLAVIVLTYVAVTAISYSEFNTTRKNKLHVLAEVIAHTVEAPLTFDDSKAATEALSSLDAEPHIVAGAVYDSEGKPFATYRDDSTRFGPIAFPKATQYGGGGYTHTFRPVVLDGKLLGFVYLKSDEAEMRDLLAKFLFSGIAIILLCAWAAFAIATRLQKAISRPIVDLTRLSTRVSAEKNYNLRAEKRTGDELGVLTDRFNEMLAEIQKGEEALVRSNESLKQVNLDLSRTQTDLAALNRELEAKVRERTAVAEERAAKLREMAMAITAVEEKERKRLAQILHDHLQQFLVAAKIELSRLASSAENHRRKESFERLGRLMEEAIQMSRTMAVDLSPPILQTTGLIPAIEWLSRWFKDQHHLDVRLSWDAPFESVSDLMPEEIKTFLFNAARELLFNIVKHSGSSEGEVRLAFTAGEARVEVRDSGRGFDPGAVTTQSQGIGLFNIQERASMLGGSLDVHGEPGMGACFILSVPLQDLAAAGAEADAGEASGEARGRRRDKRDIRVLVVDDHKILREGIIRLLADSDEINVIGEASDGEEAVEKTMDLDPDVIIMDINMPRMNGIDATKTIKGQRPQTKIISLSIHSPEDMAETMRRAGSDAYLSKNGPLDDLVKTIQTLAA